MPPIYWSTAIQRFAIGGLVGSCSSHGSVKRRKYQDESTKVSIVSVSRRAGPEHFGHLTFFQVGCRSSGLPGTSNDTSSGRVTGRSPASTGTVPHFSQ